MFAMAGLAGLLGTLPASLLASEGAAPKVTHLDAPAVISQQPKSYFGWPTLTALPNGNLMLVASGGRDYHVCPFGRVEEMTSRDGGKTWSWPRVILDSVTDDRDAGILVTAKGTLLVSTFTSTAYIDHLNNPERLLKKAFGEDLEAHLARWRRADAGVSAEQKQADVGMWLIRSEDGGKTWSSRQTAPCNSPHGPTQLSDGRLLYAGKELWTDDKKAGVWESKDDGQTWQHLADFPVREGDSLKEYHEVHAVEAADGTLLAHIRDHNQKKRQTLQTESHDGGKTWSIPREIGVEGFPSHLLRLKDDSLLMTYGFRKPPFGIRGKISKDNGKTWSEEFRLTEDGHTSDLGYPSTAQLSDGTLVTIWYEVMQGSPNAVLRQARWKLE